MKLLINYYLERGYMKTHAIVVVLLPLYTTFFRTQDN